MHLKAIIIGVLLARVGLTASVNVPDESDVSIIAEREDSSLSNITDDWYHRHHHHLPKCSKHTKSSCIVHEHGNMNAKFANHTINYGTFHPADAIDIAARKCSGGGCFPFTIKKTSTVAYKGTAYKATISIRVTGAFDSKNKVPMLRALRAASRKITKSKRVKAATHVGFVRFYTQHRHPALFRISLPVHTKYGTSPNFQFATAVQVHMGSNDGFCTDFFTVGSVIAGPMNAAAGGLFTLGSLACDA